eukprot:3358661-Pleurochrysis_carterae.AAC.2
MSQIREAFRLCTHPQSMDARVSQSRIVAYIERVHVVEDAVGRGSNIARVLNSEGHGAEHRDKLAFHTISNAFKRSFSILIALRFAIRTESSNFMMSWEMKTALV